jgi:hypothetical protein
MEVLSETDLAARLDFMRPLHPQVPVKSESTWCIPFEYGSNEPGTRISVSKAREIASELRMHVAEYERRELRRALDREKEQAESLGKRAIELQDAMFSLETQVATLKAKLRGKKKGGLK